MESEFNSCEFAVHGRKNGLWYSYFKPAMCALVGYEAKRRELQTDVAYDVAVHHLYNLLPDCRHECMCNG